MQSKELPPPYQQIPDNRDGGIYPSVAPQPQPQPQQVHTTQVVVTAVPTPYAFGPSPVTATCPYCHAVMRTRVEMEANTKTHLFALILCLFGCWPCCCIPYCVESCQSRKHFCPNCNAYIATYSD